MLDELINLFEDLKAKKVNKFSNNNYHSYDKETINFIKEKLEDYETNIYALCDLEKYINVGKSKNETSYISSVIEILRIYQNNPDIMLEPDMEQNVREDDEISSRLNALKMLVDGKSSPDITYEPVLDEIKKLDYIIDVLKETTSNEYIDEGVMELIKDYLKDEIYIPYDTKFIKIWKLIANYNIEAAKKRTKA